RVGVEDRVLYGAGIGAIQLTKCQSGTSRDSHESRSCHVSINRGATENAEVNVTHKCAGWVVFVAQLNKCVVAAVVHAQYGSRAARRTACVDLPWPQRTSGYEEKSEYVHETRTQSSHR